MEGAHQSYCDDCIVPLSVRHVLEECPSYWDQRMQFFLSNNVRISDILGEDNTEYGGKLYKFIESIGFLDRI